MSARQKKQFPRVVIAIPLASPFIYWRTVASILEMDKPSECDLMVFQGALVDRARNHLIEKMLDHPIDPTHLFFMDADILPAPDTLGKLLQVDRPIVSGLYRKRLPPFELMAFVRPHPSAFGRHPLLAKERDGERSGMGRGLRPISLRGPRLRQVDYVGAGCFLIRREVFEKVSPPWFTSEWREEGHLSEDFSFCERAREKGYEIWVDTAVRPLHLEPIGVGTSSKGKVDLIPLA